MTVNGMAELQEVFTDARAYGARLAHMLASSGLPHDVQQAWAELIPLMTLAQLQHVEVLLRARMNAEVQHEFEDAFLEIRAEIAKHTLAVAGAEHSAHVALDDIEHQLDALERAGGKRST